MLRSVTAAAVLCVTAPAQSMTSDQFDLVCTGTADVLQGTTRTASPFNQVLRLDLRSGQYCLDECDRILTLKSADPLLITLVDVPLHGGLLTKRMEKRTIDRRTGAYRIDEMDVGQLTAVTVKATCSPRAFTPFPKTKF